MVTVDLGREAAISLAGAGAIVAIAAQQPFRQGVAVAPDHDSGAAGSRAPGLGGASRHSGDGGQRCGKLPDGLADASTARSTTLQKIGTLTAVSSSRFLGNLANGSLGHRSEYLCIPANAGNPWDLRATHQTLRWR